MFDQKNQIRKKPVVQAVSPQIQILEIVLVAVVADQK